MRIKKRESLGIHKEDFMLIAPHNAFPLECDLLPKAPSPWEGLQALASLIVPLTKTKLNMRLRPED